MSQDIRSTPPRVTVIIPTYNRASLICETVGSILAQDYPNLELLIIDDGSTDGTEAVLARYGDKIRYFHHQNQGEAATVNRGWNLASGKYVAVVSSDDPVRPGWLSAGVEFMEAHPDVIVGYPDWVMIDDDGNEIMKTQVFEYSLERLLGWWHCLPGPGTFIRRELLDDITELRNPSCRYISDMETWTRLSLRGKFARIPGFWANWRYHGGATTVSAPLIARANETIRVAEGFYARNDLPQHVETLRAMGLSRAYVQASRVILGAAPLKSLEYYRHSIKLYASDPPGLPEHMRRRVLFYIRDALAAILRLWTRMLGLKGVQHSSGKLHGQLLRLWGKVAKRDRNREQL